MKKLLLLLVPAIALVGCSNDNGTSDPDVNITPPGTDTDGETPSDPDDVVDTLKAEDTAYGEFEMRFRGKLSADDEMWMYPGVDDEYFVDVIHREEFWIKGDDVIIEQARYGHLFKPSTDEYTEVSVMNYIYQDYDTMMSYKVEAPDGITYTASEGAYEFVTDDETGIMNKMFSNFTMIVSDNSDTDAIVKLSDPLNYFAYFRDEHNISGIDDLNEKNRSKFITEESSSTATINTELKLDGISQHLVVEYKNIEKTTDACDRPDPSDWCLFADGRHDKLVWTMEVDTHANLMYDVNIGSDFEDFFKDKIQPYNVGWEGLKPWK